MTKRGLVGGGMSSYLEKIGRIRAHLALEGAAGAVLSTPDIVFYATLLCDRTFVFYELVFQT